MQWILGLGLALLLFVVLKHWGGLTPEQKKTAGWKLGVGIFCGILLLLVLTGRVHVLVAGVAALLPLLRKLPLLVRHLPFLNRLYQQYKEPDSGPADGASQQRAPAASGGMSVREACEILGVGDGCSADDVVAAHRRLMQKIHPDRGGNDYLAAKVNEAKSVLLRK
ncbi:molecular chaperone DnaJ [Marinobacter caseinilyticus]|uniref:molecular chaperone DnaJ n=1 Tax=Marinobacter caseinilyticus TaxID=2692195 RepID=UPI00140E024A|nr:molecular chaperone DnaJ [Marinobacter caseinilyticus]